MIRRLGLTPGHVELPPKFFDGRAKDSWRRTVYALYKKGLLFVQKDHVLDEVFVLLTPEGLRCAGEVYRTSELTQQERRAHQQLVQWRADLTSKPKPARPSLTLCPPPAEQSPSPAQHSAATRAGLARAQKNGVRLGRPRVVIPEERVQELRAHGKSIRSIGLAVGVGTATMQRYFKRKARA